MPVQVLTYILEWDNLHMELKDASVVIKDRKAFYEGFNSQILYSSNTPSQHLETRNYTREFSITFHEFLRI